MIKRLLSRVTHRLYDMPILLLMPHSRCNCRCVMCDIWKANQQKQELPPALIMAHADHFSHLGVREVVLSGGEALMHENLWSLCREFRQRKMKVVLLSTGLLLEKNSESIGTHIDEVIVSLDGSKAVHDRIRNVPGAYEKLASGVLALRKERPEMRITGRCVLQRANYDDFLNIVGAAKELTLNAISFLPADVYSSAFNRAEAWAAERVSEVALSAAEAETFERIINDSFGTLQREYASGFIAESPAKMTRIATYFKAVNGMADFPGNRCNAPWVSAVIESDGRVLPCFFHPAYGNLRDGGFREVVNSPAAIAFRKQLDTRTNDTCRKCVCSLNLGWSK